MVGVKKFHLVSWTDRPRAWWFPPPDRVSPSSVRVYLFDRVEKLLLHVVLSHWPWRPCPRPWHWNSKQPCAGKSPSWCKPYSELSLWSPGPLITSLNWVVHHSLLPMLRAPLFQRVLPLQSQSKAKGYFSHQDPRGCSVCPKHIGKLICPWSFSFVEPFFNPLEDSSIHNLGFYIGLGMHHKSEVVWDFLVFAKFFKLSLNKLPSLVDDQYLGMLKRQMMALHMKSITLNLLMRAGGLTSTHLVK